MKAKCILTLAVIFSSTILACSASFFYSGSRAENKPSFIDSAYIEKNIEITHLNSSFILNLDEKKYILSKRLFSRLVDENVWMDAFEIKGDNKMYILFFEINNNKSVLKNFGIREEDGITHLFKDDNSVIQWEYVPAIFINFVSFANRDKKGRIINDFGSTLTAKDMDILLSKIAYQSLSPGRHVDLKIRIIDPRGNTLKNSSSPKGYTFSASVETSDEILDITDTILEWSNQSRIEFKKGKYSVEIYDKERLLNASTLVLRGIIVQKPILATCHVCRGTGKIVNYGSSWENCPMGHGKSRKIVVGYREVEE